MNVASTTGSAAPAAANESFLLLANGTQGLAAVALVQQVLESPNVFVFGELLDHPHIQALAQGTPEARQYLRLLEIFAFADYPAYHTERAQLPDLSPPMGRKLRLLSICSMATRNKILPYARLQQALDVASVRQLEDLIIDGANANVIQGKLDQQAGQFEVDYTMARDIQKTHIPTMLTTLNDWCNSCDQILVDLEEQVQRANDMKKADLDHRSLVENKVNEIRKQIKAQHQHSGESVSNEDPDSQMVTDRLGPYERREKKVGKSKAGGPRTPGTAASTSSTSGGAQGKGFWHK